MTFIRATRPEQKKLREEQILNAAKKLFLRGDYESAGLNAIAREAGLTKSNVYRYFASREEIFLRIFSAASVDWALGLESTLKKLRARASADTVAAAWTEETIKHPLFHDLAPLTTISLEKNSSEEHLRDFFSKSLAVFSGVATQLARIYPGIPMEVLTNATVHFYMLGTSLWSASRPGQTERKVLKDPAFAALAIDFESSLTTGIANLIRGIRTQW